MHFFISLLLWGEGKGPIRILPHSSGSALNTDWIIQHQGSATTTLNTYLVNLLPFPAPKPIIVDQIEAVQLISIHATTHPPHTT